MATPVDQSDQNLSSMNRLSSAPTSVPDTKAAPEISDLYKNCLNAYEKTQDALLPSTHDHATENKFDRDGLIVSLQESRSKFKAWAQNIAAFQSSRLRTSLDYRLKEAAGIRERIVTILQELLDSLSEALPIISGDEPNDTWKVGSFSDSESDDETNSQASEEVVRTSELDELFSVRHEWGENMQGPEKDSKRLFLHDGRTVEPNGTLKQFRRHLGRHMEQLALFALPKNDGDEMEDQIFR
ncbi:hypothetical protein HYALB_00013483 [Hymenoscyphus albidus]|uniref:Uncharacterized protein n=1 Tax=Hymenoscyphus albidus TaxID=595503 RepID=A0A9N9LWW7_9HELO|nr:hypothetical protein HYALB_00013483 [Hymenoscyphus albidus]